MATNRRFRLNANYGWDNKNFVLTAGELSDTAEHVFTHGHCHSLALAIHDATGWPLLGGGDSGDVYGDYCDILPLHVGVETPDGAVLDIRGLHEPWDWEERWGYVDYVDPDAARGAFSDYYRTPRVDAARHWVRPVIEAHAPEYLHLLAPPAPLFEVIAEIAVTA